MSLQSFRERINLLIYDSKVKVLTILQFISISVSLVAISLLTYYYGFPQNEASTNWVINCFEVTFAYYILHYFLRVFYDFSPLQFLKQNWMEGVLMLLLVVEGISYNFFDALFIQSFFVKLGFSSFSAFSALFTQAYLLIIVSMELSRSANIIPDIKLHPSNIFMLSFGVLIAFGTVLLMLPEMTVHPGSMPFIDALFTSTSATCVTGLIVEDTATYFSFKGQFVILLLMKLGGLNIVSFASLLAFLGRFGIGVKQHSVMKDFITKESLFSAKGLFVKILSLSLIFEVAGTAALYFLSGIGLPMESVGDKLFFSAFHAVSAFNNAGFSTMTNGLGGAELEHAYLLHVVIGILVFAGAIGFTTLFDLFSPKKLRDRLKHPWKTPHMGTRIAVNMYMFLIVVGALVFFLAEYSNVLAGTNFVEGAITSVFQSISARSAGFNTIDIGAMTMPVTIFIVLLMFIGGSSYSTAGGIKTSTFTILLLSIISTIRGKNAIEIYNRTIPNGDLLKAYSILMFSIGGILTGFFVLSFTEQHILALPDRDIMDLIFEQTSAFSTCGLSTGITPMLSDTGKLVVAISMYIGRLGTLTVAFALGKKLISANYKFPEEHMMVG